MAFRNSRINTQVKAQGLYGLEYKLNHKLGYRFAYRLDCKLKDKLDYKVRCGQVLNRVRIACPRLCSQLEQVKKDFNINFPQTAHTESLMFKGFDESWDVKRECGSSS